MAATPANNGRLSRLTSAGQAFRAAKGLYVVGAGLPRADALKYHRFAVIAHAWPGAVLVDRTALAGGNPVDGWMFVAHPAPPRVTDLRLDGLSISVRVGPGPLPGDIAMPNGLYLSGQARKLIENVDRPGQPARGRPARQAGTSVVEDTIDEIARVGGAGQIAHVLSELDVIGGSFPAGPVDTVRSALAALLGTSQGKVPTSARLAARLAGEPFDEHRVGMLRDLVSVLNTTAPEPRPAVGPPERWQWEPFYEAYFSNYIEGTQFPVDVARSIAIDGVVPPARPADAHDIAATFRLVSDPAASALSPTSADEFIDVLRDQHATLMAARPDKCPGMFKTVPNYAGGYTFVDPELVLSTLRNGFDLLAGVADPLHRAVALMLLVTECHPFDDGNGRMARIVANAALSKAGQVRIIVPTVYRNNYLAGLSGVSNGNGKGETLIAVLDFAQRWTAAIDWSDYQRTSDVLESVHAYMDAGLADREGIKLRLPT